MRDVIRGALAGLAVLVLAGAFADRAGWITATVPRLPGTAPWIIARASGIAAFLALATEVLLGLLTSTRLATGWLSRADRVELHRWLSPLTLALVAGHAGVLLADDFVRFDALDLVVPFVAPGATVGLGLGVLALYLAVVVHVSFALRRRLGTRVWRRLHSLSFAAFVLAAVHALAAGTDRGQPWALLVFGLPTAAVAGLIVARVAGTLASPRKA